MTFEDALALIQRTPQLDHLSGTAKQICAYAFAIGAPLRPVTTSEDAVRLLCAEQLVRIEGDRIDAAVAIARSGVCDATLRGCVRAASSLLAENECSALMMERGHRTLREMSREDMAALGLELFTRAPATVDESEIVRQVNEWLPQPAPAELTSAGSDVVGECLACGGAVVFDSTLALYWKDGWIAVDPTERTDSVRKKMAPLIEGVRAIDERLAAPKEAGAEGDPEWAELGQRRVELQEQYAVLNTAFEKAKTAAPRKGSKLYALLAGTEPVACGNCTMSWLHTWLELPDPGAEPFGAEVEEQAAGAAEDAPVVREEDDAVAGLLDRDRCVADAILRLAPDPRRVEALKAKATLTGRDAELEYALLAVAWERARPLRPTSVPADREKLNRAVDVALRGGAPEWVLGGA